jgi:hypothetical protein
MEKLTLTRTSFNKDQYEKVIDTRFSQLANTTEVEESPTSVLSKTIEIDDFFDKYEQLFFQIPKLGETRSHEYLIKKSSEYVGSSLTNDEIQALIDEINILQQQNLELNQRLVEIQVSSSQQI